MSFTDLISFPVKSKMGACDLYNIQECKQISPGYSRSVLNIVGSTVVALSPVSVVLFLTGERDHYVRW